MGSELSPAARRVIRGLLAGKSLNDLSPPGDPVHEEVSAYLTGALEGAGGNAASRAASAPRKASSRPKASSSRKAPPSRKAPSPRKASPSRKAPSTQEAAGHVSPARGGASVAYSDGASRGNPGPAAYGIRILGADGRELHASGVRIGRATNNVAEYRGAIAALETARSLGIRRLELRLDSELVVKQVRGEYRVKDANLAALKAELDRFIRGFESFRVSHVRRGENTETDRLANEALDGE